MSSPPLADRDIPPSIAPSKEIPLKSGDFSASLRAGRNDELFFRIPIKHKHQPHTNQHPTQYTKQYQHPPWLSTILQWIFGNIQYLHHRCLIGNGHSTGFQIFHHFRINGICYHTLSLRDFRRYCFRFIRSIGI